MPTEVIMPKVDMDMETGRISVWHVEEGAEVRKGDPLFDIETDKAAMEVESPATGRLGGVAASVGDDVAIGKTVAWVYAEGEEIDTAPVRDDAPTPVQDEPEAPARTEQIATTAHADPADKPRATPLARRLARQHDLTLSEIKGSGPGGRISRVDIEAALTTRPSGSEPAAGRDDRSILTDGRLAVHRVGSADPRPFVFLHGLTGDSSGWARLERHLGDAPRIKIDLPGHGRSPHREIAAFEDLTGAVLEAFDSEGVANAHLVGHSLGGALALALADQRPRAVASLTLLAPAGLGAEIEGAVLRGIAKASQVDSLAPWLKRLVSDTDMIGWDYAKAAMLARTDERLRETQTRMIAKLLPDDTQSFDLTDCLGRIAVPTRIVWGRDDAIVPWRHALRAPGRVALHVLPGVGHLPQLEAPAIVADILKAQRTSG